VCISFAESLLAPIYGRANLLSRDNAWGAIIATGFACVALVTFVRSPAAHNADWIVEASSQKTDDGMGVLRVFLPKNSEQMTDRGGLAPLKVVQTHIKPQNIVDTYAPTPMSVRIDHEAEIQNHLLNRQFQDAQIVFTKLIDQNGVPSLEQRARWETQALRQIRPIPASDRQANLNGYQFLSMLRPDEPSYRAKIDRYSE